MWAWSGCYGASWTVWDCAARLRGASAVTKSSDRVLRWTAAATLARGLRLARTANVLGRFTNPPKAMKAVESGVRWRSFGGVADRRGARSTRSDGVVAREIGTAQTLLTPDQVDELVERHKAGEGVVALAKAYGVHRSTVTAHIDRRGARRRLGLTDGEVQRAGRLYLRGMTLDAIAAELGTSQRTAGRAVAGLGIPRRPAGPRRRLSSS